MSFRAFLSSKTFLINLGIAALITLALLLVIFYSIRGYTNHGESFAIPDFKNMDQEEFRRVTEQYSLHYEISDSIYTENVAPGAVIDQYPAAGFAVKEGRTVFLTICARNPEQVALPTLTDISLRQAVSLMQGVGLNVGTIEYVPSEYPNLVLAQKFHGDPVAAGKMIDRGSKIDLVVGRSGSGEMTFVPDLTGVTLGQAKDELVVLNLALGAVIYDESVLNTTDSLNARIWQQRPDPRDGETDQGTSVDLWLTVDEEKIGAEMGFGESAGQNKEETE